MRFVVREGRDPVAGADRVMLAAMGMPGGGIIEIGTTHVLVSPRETDEPTALLLGPQTMTNGGLVLGQVVEARRKVLPQATTVRMRGTSLPADRGVLIRALQGRPVTSGDSVTIDPAYLDGNSEPIEVGVLEVIPGAAVVGTSTTVITEGDVGESTQPQTAPAPPTTAEALLAGLDVELEVLAGWLRLLTSPEDLPTAWGLPHVAGVVLEGPAGCGKSELVHAAAAEVGVPVREVDLNLVFKPERLLQLLEEAISGSEARVVFVDRVEAVAGEEGLAPFRTQVAAILRWFLDAVADRPRMACVIGVASAVALGEWAGRSTLLPRTLSVPPPDLRRRRLLFEAALAKVPSSPLDFDLLAARSAGFSAADVVAAAVHASALVARRRGPLTMDLMVEAVEQTPPSLGAVSAGDVPSYGFDRVADLEEVKQRLTEAVIWPIIDPDRFARMGIDPPRGILLFGPPGTGKTFVVRAVASESGAAFFAVKGAELLDKFVGESERGVREIFARARAAAPSVMFFDEFDALAPVRGRSTTTVMDSVVAALLTELDGIASRPDVPVIAATNRKDLIDPALLRPGRFEVHIELDLPGVEARRALLAMTDVPFAPEVDLDRVAELTAGFSFADLSGLLREAALAALRRDPGAISVGWSEIEPALQRFRRSASQ